MFSRSEKASHSEKAHLPSSAPVKYAGLNGNALLYTIVATATVGFSLFGYDQGLMSGIVNADQFNTEFPEVSGEHLLPYLPSRLTNLHQQPLRSGS